MKLVKRKKEELPDYYKYLSYEESKGLINEAQLGDIKLAICRNVGDGYTEKRSRGKIQLLQGLDISYYNTNDRGFAKRKNNGRLPFGGLGDQRQCYISLHFM